MKKDQVIVIYKRLIEAVDNITPHYKNNATSSEIKGHIALLINKKSVTEADLDSVLTESIKNEVVEYDFRASGLYSHTMPESVREARAKHIEKLRNIVAFKIYDGWCTVNV